jgi:hypothetical protein
MKTKNQKLEKCRRLIAELNWNERSSEQNARIAVSKAVWLGLDKHEVLHQIDSIPQASYLRQFPHIFLQAWAVIARATAPDQHLTDVEQLLYALN